MSIIKKQNYTWYIHDNWVIFFSAFLTDVISIIFTKIKTKYVSSNTNEQFERNGIKTPSFKVRNGVVSSLLLYLIILIVSKIRLKQ